MTLLGQAIAIAADVHKDQTDKADAPYMLHCIAVMRYVQPNEDAMIVAIMHDVLEDCDPLDRGRWRYLIGTTFGDYILEALDALTHRKGESYDDYIERVALVYLARVVKVADLTNNMDPRRIPAYQIVDKDFHRWDRYRKALVRLQREE